MQAPHAVHFVPSIATSGAPSRLSGLWHQSQRRGQPLMKTVVRIPGPSWIEHRWMLKTATPDGVESGWEA